MFDQPLVDEMLWQWHAMLFDGMPHMHDCGQYRTHTQPMQIVSRRYDSTQVFFEAPPSTQVPAGFKGGWSAEKYISITKTSRATATRDLSNLVERGVLVKTGELRHTRYWLNLM